jgi:hypothetical protein
MTVSATETLIGQRHEEERLSVIVARVGEVLLETGVTVPIGQTAVLGSTAPGGKIQALILVIRPELAPSPDS